MVLMSNLDINALWHCTKINTVEDDGNLILPVVASFVVGCLIT